MTQGKEASLPSATVTFGMGSANLGASVKPEILRNYVNFWQIKKVKTIWVSTLCKLYRVFKKNRYSDQAFTTEKKIVLLALGECHNGSKIIFFLSDVTALCTRWTMWLGNSARQNLLFLKSIKSIFLVSKRFQSALKSSVH